MIVKQVTGQEKWRPHIYTTLVSRAISIPLNPIIPLPLGYSFFQITEHNCLACGKYTTIDQFAKDCRLQGLWNIHSADPVSAGTPESRAINASRSALDAIELLQALERLPEE
jgi:hypothetical protein